MPFETAVDFIFRMEGGAQITNHPDDPGGLTKWGISKRSYPMLDIENLTREQAAEIYRRDYWEAASCESFPEPIALALFDAAVNQGPGPAIKLLQLALGVHVDGVVGPATIAAAKEADPQRLLVAYAARRWERYYQTGGAGVFLRGWTRRLFEVVAEGMCLAALKET